MPELPQMQALAERLDAELAGAQLVGVETLGFSALKTVNKDAYGNEALKKQGDILVNASTFRFDGSDLMPGKIGAGAFWTGMIDLVGGKPAADVAADIQKSWDAIK